MKTVFMDLDINSMYAVPIQPLNIDRQAIGRTLRKRETDNEKVARLLKGDFEMMIGMSFDEFCKIREDLIENHPEMLV